VMEVAPVVTSRVDLPNRCTEPGPRARESARTDPAPVWDVVPDVDGLGHRALSVPCTDGSVGTVCWARVRECLPKPDSRQRSDLVLDLRCSVPLQCIECGSHSLELLGRMTDPVDKLAN